MATSSSSNLALFKAPEIPKPQPMNANGNLFGDLGRVTNPTSRVPLNQIPGSFTSPSLSQVQSLGSNQLNTFQPLNVLNPMQSTANKNSQDKSVALSAQEINDFLS